MLKINKKNYEAIIKAKNNISDIIEQDIFDLSSQGGIEELIYCFVRSSELSIREKIALWTVIENGSFVEDLRWGYHFMMPSTKACCENFAICEHKYKKGLPLKLFVYFEGDSHTERFYVPYSSRKSLNF